MAGEQIALLCLLHLRNALKATVTSKEFVDLKVFKRASDIILCDNFWTYRFMMCRSLYAPMLVLCLADQKSPAMDKLYFYVLQTDAMLPKYLGDLDKHSNGFLSLATIASMVSVPLAGDSDSEDNDDSSDDKDEDEEQDGDESDNEDVDEIDMQNE